MEQFANESKEYFDSINECTMIIKMIMMIKLYIN
jgi:hypothetical protein